MQTRNKILDDISQLMTNAMGVAQKAREENDALAARLAAIEGRAGGGGRVEPGPEGVAPGP